MCLLRKPRCADWRATVQVLGSAGRGSALPSAGKILYSRLFIRIAPITSKSQDNIPDTKTCRREKELHNSIHEFHVIRYGIINTQRSFRYAGNCAHALPAGPSPPGINCVRVVRACQVIRFIGRHTMQTLFPFSKSLGSLIWEPE